LLEGQVWGQGLPAPTFDDVFTVARQRVVGEQHLKVRLMRDDNEVEAMLFSHAGALPDRIRAIYRLAVNEWNGSQALQLTIEHWQPA
jgi:single-stranded-DNA-specific exonuclease